MVRALVTAACAAFILRAAYGQVGTNSNCTSVDSSRTYDYIIIGSGAGGMPMAERLSASGASVLMIEKGPLSSGRWNGTMKPAWLGGTNLTRFDVPGLFNQIWADAAGVACEDMDVMAGW
jgi:cellobiose dehydrogenase (acceptor)